MSDQIERLLPVLSLIPGVNIPAGFLQGIYVAASQRKMAQLEQALKYEISHLNQKVEAGKLKLDREYVRSEAFNANVVQALRGAEIADSQEKIQYIARALVGCSIYFEDIDVNKTICMRLIEQITYEEIDHIVSILKDGRFSRDINSITGAAGFAETDETAHVTKGLFQLGLLEIANVRLGASPTLRPSILAEHLARICQESI